VAHEFLADVGDDADLDEPGEEGVAKIVEAVAGMPARRMAAAQPVFRLPMRLPL